jgi:polyphenol oxidase
MQPPFSTDANWQWQTHTEGQPPIAGQPPITGQPPIAAPRPYLTCALLADWQHGFFTQQFTPMNPFEITASLYPGTAAYRAKQVHGNTIWSPSAIPQPHHNDNLADGDGVVSEVANQAVWVCTADCTPVLIGDVRTGQVGAVHAGWRGTSQKIVPMAIARLQAQGSKLEDLRVALGPAIAGEVYQVDWDVAIATATTIAPEIAPLEASAAIAALLNWTDSPILADQSEGKVRLDVRRVNQLQMEQLGLAPEQIAIAPHCTFADPVNFFSHRRAPLRKAQWSGIVSR